MDKWSTIKSLIENKDFEGLQDILHDEYLYLRETTLISKDEMVSFIKKRFEDGLTFEKLELIIENKDLLAWRDVLTEHGGKNGKLPMCNYGKIIKSGGMLSAFVILRR